MGLKEVLSKMKIVEVEDEPTVGMGNDPVVPSGPGPSSLKGAPNDIQELLGTMPPAREIDVTALPPETQEGSAIPDFPAIFKAAGITDPPHGYSAYKVLEILSSPEFANLDSRAKAAALSGFLKMNPSGPVPISDVVQDAVRRDQALDKFEDFLRSKLKDRTDQIEKENRDLQAEIDALAMRNREKMDGNRKTLASEEERFARWQVTKRVEERKLFDAVAPFVETNPISTGAAATAVPKTAPNDTEGSA
jgi:hypothetical protein